MKTRFTWSKLVGYECSTKGDPRFSEFTAQMPDGRTIEQWYQCDIKGYDIGGTNWRLGKGQKPNFPYPDDHLWQMYLGLWRIWTIHNSTFVLELRSKAIENSGILRDRFANHTINQANALANILNQWFPIQEGE